MNLLKDTWLPAVRKDGSKEKIAIWQILDKYHDNPIIDIEVPRPDFRNAIYQLLIGIIQVAAMPKEEDEWRELWDSPYPHDEFKKKILAYEDCFEIDSNGPAFMQDYALNDFKEEDLTNLFVDLPSNEHFNKLTPRKVDAYWAAITLYALQTFGPPGGRGHKTGLRGGGPLTTILYPMIINSKPSNVEQGIWMNTLSDDYTSTLTGNYKLYSKSDIFPWMKPTKISSTSDSGLFPQECHPFHMFFGMPRRIRLVFTQEKGECDISSEYSVNLVTAYRTYHSGNDYKGFWIHPLNPYRRDPQKPEEPPNPIKGRQPDALAYKNWTRYSLFTNSEINILAPVVSISQSSRQRREVIKENYFAIWAAGFSMDKMKANCWYESMLPVFALEIKESALLEEIINYIISFTSDISSALTYRIKEAWFRSPKEASGDLSYISTAFWQNTESDFYALLSKLVKNIFDEENISECASEWRRAIRSHALSLFDTWALSGQEDGLDIKRVVTARNGLLRAINGASKKNNINNMIEKS